MNPFEIVHQAITSLLVIGMILMFLNFKNKKNEISTFPVVNEFVDIESHKQFCSDKEFNYFLNLEILIKFIHKMDLPEYEKQRIMNEVELRKRIIETDIIKKLGKAQFESHLKLYRGQ